MKKSIHDIETGEVTVVDMTEDELAAMDAKVAAKLLQDEAQSSAKSALLDRLGITADEAKLLLS